MKRKLERHVLSCPCYSNYQPPYEDCNCGYEEEEALQAERLVEPVPVVQEERNGDLPCGAVRDTPVIYNSRMGLEPLALLGALRQKKTSIPIHGHSTCAADPEVVLWRDIEEILMRAALVELQGEGRSHE